MKKKKLELRNRLGVKYLREVYIDQQLWGVLPVKLLSLYLYLEELEDYQEVELKDYLYRYARERLFNYLAKQEHSEYESKQYLKKLNFHYSIISKVIDFCLDKKFISDARLTELYVRSMIELGKSKNDIRYKLKLKGVDINLIESELDKQYSQDDKLRILEDNVDKLVRRYSNQDSKKVYDKCCAYLMRKGFKYSDFSYILKERLNQ